MKELIHLQKKEILNRNSTRSGTQDQLFTLGGYFGVELGISKLTYLQPYMGENTSKSCAIALTPLFEHCSQKTYATVLMALRSMLRLLLLLLASLLCVKFIWPTLSHPYVLQASFATKSTLSTLPILRWDVVFSPLCVFICSTLSPPCGVVCPGSSYRGGCWDSVGGMPLLPPSLLWVLCIHG